MIELYLSGTVFGVLLYQQEKLVFHASCITIKGKGALLLAGESGAGKSSLATALYSRGYQFLSDDACGLFERDGQIMVIPAFPMMKVSPEVARLLNFDMKLFSDVHSTESKKFYPGHNSEEQSCPVRGLLILKQGVDTSLIRINARQAMIEIVRHTIPTRLLHRTGDKLHFSQCASVAAKVPAFQLERTENLADLSQLADLVEQQIMMH